VAETLTTLGVRGSRASAHSESSYSLPPELLAQGSRRLGWLGLLYSTAAMVSYSGRRELLIWAGTDGPGVRATDVLTLIAVFVGIAVFLLSRSGLLSKPRLLDAGLVFQVVAAFGIAGSTLWTGPPSVLDVPTSFVPAECPWILMFPLFVPNTPRKILIASLLSASMGPLALGLSVARTGLTGDGAIAFAIYYLTSNYLCAIFAYIGARIVYGFGIRLEQLRDIGSYALVELIGLGGMGVVWRARHRLLARPAAIKLIRAELLGSNQGAREAVVQRFEQEARETAALRSIHTIDVYDFGVAEDGSFYYVMELLEGISLERYVRTFGPMAPARTVYLLRQVLHSLAEAHDRGLLHRDIKPQNIFMCRLGPDDDFVKVLDFGLVKKVEPTGTRRMLTKEGTIAGTPEFMAPEIALGREAIDGRADIYSLGCVGYYLLTGRPVFTAPSPVATLLRHVNDSPVPPRKCSDFAIPPALEAVTLQCLAKDPAERPPSAAALERSLAAAVSPEAWGPELAHAWWDLHASSLGVGTRPSQIPLADTVLGAAPVPRREGRGSLRGGAPTLALTTTPVSDDSVLRVRARHTR
jgi:serine/threonine-protein kinase